MKVKVIITPQPFEIEVDCNSAEEARDIAMERFADKIADGEYLPDWNQWKIETIV